MSTIIGLLHDVMDEREVKTKHIDESQKVFIIYFLLFISVLPSSSGPYGVRQVYHNGCVLMGVLHAYCVSYSIRQEGWRNRGEH